MLLCFVLQSVAEGFTAHDRCHSRAVSSSSTTGQSLLLPLYTGLPLTLAPSALSSSFLGFFVAWSTFVCSCRVSVVMFESREELSDTAAGMSVICREVVNVVPRPQVLSQMYCIVLYFSISIALLTACAFQKRS